MGLGTKHSKISCFLRLLWLTSLPFIELNPDSDHVCMSVWERLWLSVCLLYFLVRFYQKKLYLFCKQTNNAQKICARIHATFLLSVYSCCSESRGIFYTEKKTLACLQKRKWECMKESLIKKVIHFVWLGLTWDTLSKSSQTHVHDQENPFSYRHA